ncbi:MAG: ABC transporter ATP-binding protein [Spirochaetia bacterium]|jgi:branched-chain amino acid transport system ATP-binding protein
MSALLQVNDLHIHYGALEALKGVTLSVEEGEVVTVLGANGAGKSTLLRAISGLLPAREGEILFNGASLSRTPAYDIVLRGISHAPEGRKVFSTLTVEENLNLGAFTRRNRRGEVMLARDRVFELFPLLKDRRGQLAGTLSGGEQQMLAIGRALMSTPRILLLDEPSLGLAPILVHLIFDIIQEINRQGIAILLVEQNAHQALALARRGYVLETGLISAHGTSEELQSDRRIQEAYLGGSGLNARLT